MEITLVNCISKFKTRGIDITSGSGVDQLSSQLQNKLPLTDWGYSFTSDILTITVPDGTPVPDLSAYGDVVV